MTKPSSCETVATALERDLDLTIQKWTERVDKTPELTRIKLSREERMGHLPRLLKDIVARLRTAKNVEPPNSTAARDHGKIRFKQKYTVAMLIEDSRLLQVSIFETLHRNQDSLDSQIVLLDVMTIADECDSQLGNTIDTFMEEETEALRSAA